MLAIYPHLYVHDSPAGTFTITLKKSATTIFSSSFSASDIKASLDSVDDFVHTYYPVIPSGLIQVEEGNYTVELSSSGYTFSESNYIGWCRSFETQDHLNFKDQVNNETNSLQLRIKIKDIP